jgi:hypothetical protein
VIHITIQNKVTVTGSVRGRGSGVDGQQVNPDVRRDRGAIRSKGRDARGSELHGDNAVAWKRERA